MLYGFKIAPAVEGLEPGESYFHQLEQAAKQAAAVEELDEDTAFAMCEYLDCADSGAWKHDSKVYAQCVLALSNYLDTAPNVEVGNLVRKSWAAKTLQELVVTTRARESLPGIRRAAAF